MRQPVPFGKYVLLDRISIGGMAEVFKAKSFGVEGFEKVIAIKRILPSMGEDEDFISMFIDEAKIAGQLAHANIGQIHELGEVDGSHFIAMEYIQGRDLLQLQKRYRKLNKQLPTATACFIVMKICEGLHYAHKKRDVLGTSLEIVHRDCSPQNVVISYEGEVKLIDFGIARAASRSSRTQAGVLKGKFAYMSPEQVRGLPLDRRSDIFSLGTILFECLTGNRLFSAESDFSTLERVRNAEFDRNAMKAAGVPPAVEAIVLKALQRSTEDRYQWCSEMRDDLRSYLQSVDTVYTSRALGDELRSVFAKELQRDRELMDSYAQIGRDGGPIGKQEIEILVGGHLGAGTGEEAVDSYSGASSPSPCSSLASGSRPHRATSEDDDSDFGDGATEVFGEAGMAELFRDMGVDAPSDAIGLSIDEVKVEVGDQSESSSPRHSPPPPLSPPPSPVAKAQFTGAGSAPRRYSRPLPGDSGVQPLGIPDQGSVSASIPLPGRRPTTRHLKKRGAKDILVGLSIVVAAALIFFGVKTFFPSSAPAAAKTPLATLIVMVGDTKSADVYLEDQRVGEVLPGETLSVPNLKPGTYDIKVTRPGAEPCTDTIGITAERDKYYNCDFEVAMSASLLFEGLLADDKVIIDGQEIAASSLTAAVPMESGRDHSVAISREGTLFDEFNLTLEDGEERRHQVHASRVDSDEGPDTEKPDNGEPKVPEAKDPPPDDPPVDDRPATTPKAKSEKDPTRDQVVEKPNRRRVGISLDDDEDPARKPDKDPVEKPPEDKVSPDADGYFTAFTKPWARIYIDGKDTGKQTPVTAGAKIKLKPGIHEVTFEAEGKKHNFSVTIKPGETSRLVKILGL